MSAPSKVAIPFWSPPLARTIPHAAVSGTKEGPWEIGIFMKTAVWMMVPIPAAKKATCKSPIFSLKDIDNIIAKMTGGT